MSFVISMPLKIRASKAGKFYYINLNQYRNWKGQQSNNIKKHYKYIAFDRLDKIKPGKMHRIDLIFTLWKKDRRRMDKANQLCIHEKFFCDAMVEYGVIKDDNDEFINETRYRTGGIDKYNPRVDIEVIDVATKQDYNEFWLDY